MRVLSCFMFLKLWPVCYSLPSPLANPKTLFWYFSLPFLASPILPLSGFFYCLPNPLLIPSFPFGSCHYNNSHFCHYNKSPLKVFPFCCFQLLSSHTHFNPLQWGFAPLLHQTAFVKITVGYHVAKSNGELSPQLPDLSAAFSTGIHSIFKNTFPPTRLLGNAHSWLSSFLIGLSFCL